MKHRFAIGEIVIFVPDFKGDVCLHKYAGEVEVVDHLNWWSYEEYEVKAPDGAEFFAHVSVLHKRPRPPDWKAISTPAELPCETVTS